MSDGKIVFTLKSGPGYDAPWVVISGDSVDEAQGHLNALTAGSALSDIHNAAALFQGVGNAAVLTQPQAPVAQAQVPTATYPVAPAAAPVASVPSAPPANTLMCQHGQRTRYQGNGTRGAYTAYFCSLPKGTPGACKPIFQD